MLHQSSTRMLCRIDGEYRFLAAGVIEHSNIQLNVLLCGGVLWLQPFVQGVSDEV
jgi:hypothetical protein